MKGYLPSNLNLGAEKHSDKYYYIITMLYYGRIFDKRRTRESFIPLYSKILHSVLSNYRRYLNDLIENGVIETNNQYRVGEESKGYRLTPKYANVKFREVQIRDKRINEKIICFREKQKQKIKLNQHRYIYDCLEKVSMDVEGARSLIEVSNLNEYEYSSYSISVDMIESQTWFQTVDSTAGRVHNNITNLSKKLRPFLRYENKPLVEVDVRNSQPFFFNLLIRDYFNPPSPSVSLPSFPTFLPYVTKSKTECTDLELYRELTSTGEFYEYLMKKTGYNECRKNFKIRFFKNVFYSKENDNYMSADRKMFKHLFPTVAKIVSFYKKDDHRVLARLLQKAEADIMINKIVPRLADKGIYCLTIHDSILTTPENSEIVKTIMLDEFQNSLGFTPTIRIKKCLEE